MTNSYCRRDDVHTFRGLTTRCERGLSCLGLVTTSLSTETPISPRVLVPLLVVYTTNFRKSVPRFLGPKLTLAGVFASNNGAGLDSRNLLCHGPPNMLVVSGSSGGIPPPYEDWLYWFRLLRYRWRDSNNLHVLIKSSKVLEDGALRKWIHFFVSGLQVRGNLS